MNLSSCSSTFSLSFQSTTKNCKIPKTNYSLRISSILSPSSSPTSKLELHNHGRKKYMEFPYLSPVHKQLMVDLVTTIENRVGSQLLPCSLPPDVQLCKNERGTSLASIHVRSGDSSSPIDLIWASWLHAKLPTGTELNISSLTGYLNHLTDAPNFALEIGLSSPTSMILTIDLLPRKDLMISPDYIKTFYEETRLETRRKTLHSLEESKPYYAQALYFRGTISPTLIMLSIETESSERMDEIIKNEIGPIAKEVLGIWLDDCVCKKRDLNEEEIAYLKKRDHIYKQKYIELELAPNFPRMFEPEICAKALEALREVFNV